MSYIPYWSERTERARALAEAAFLTLASLVLLTVVSVNACGCGLTAKDAKNVADGIDVACVIANAFLDDATLQTVCKIQDELLPKARDIASATKAQVSKAEKAAACKPSDAVH